MYYFLTSTPAAGEWSASRPDRFTPGERAPVQLDRRLGGPQSRSGRRGIEEILDPNRTRTPAPQLSSPQPVDIQTTLPLLSSALETVSSSLKIQVRDSRPTFLSAQITDYGRCPVKTRDKSYQHARFSEEVNWGNTDTANVQIDGEKILEFYRKAFLPLPLAVLRSSPASVLSNRLWNAVRTSPLLRGNSVKLSARHDRSVLHAGRILG
jgi:hypothetical protein